MCNFHLLFDLIYVLYTYMFIYAKTLKLHFVTLRNECKVEQMDSSSVI